MLEETETEEKIGFFATFLLLVTFQLVGGVRAPGYAYVLGSFVSEIGKLLTTSAAEFNALVGAGMGSKPSWTKAVVIFRLSGVNSNLDVKKSEG